MCLTAAVLANGLEELLQAESLPSEIACWAHSLYLTEGVSPRLYEPLMSLVAMGEGEQFVLSATDLWALVEDLRVQG